MTQIEWKKDKKNDEPKRLKISAPVPQQRKKVGKKVD